MTTAADAIRESFVALGGEATIKQVAEWVGRRYPQKWSADTISTTMADLAYPGNPSSRFTMSQRFLRRVATGRYRLEPGEPGEAESLYTHRFVLALTTAAQMHRAQRRKGGDVPYVSHLLGTCAIALEYGADEDEAIAALLHDAIEDVQPATAARMAVGWFGERVLTIVEGCTDADTHPKPAWRERKERYLAHLETAERSVLLVSAADKLHNARTLVADHHKDGNNLWTRFSAGREESLWYYRSLVRAFRSNRDHPRALVNALDRAVSELDGLVGVNHDRPDTWKLEADAEATISHSSILIRIARLWDPAMTSEELYDATRGHWKVGPRREQVELAMAVADGVVRQVYMIEGWHRAGTTRSATGVHRSAPPDRWEFTGRRAPAEIRAKYVGRSVKHYFPPGNQNPIRYVGADVNASS